MSPDLPADFHGRTVLVRSAQDSRHPPAARRGTLMIEPHPPAGHPSVYIELEFPDTFSRGAHLEIIPLDESGVTRLLDSEAGGNFEYVIADRLD